MPEFIRDLRKRNSISALALEFTILCAARTGETIDADWIEFDLVKKLWTVPAKRMKAARETSSSGVRQGRRYPEVADRCWCETSRFRVSGSKARQLPEQHGDAGVPARSARSRITVHGFRSTFRDWAGDKTVFPRDIAEAALAHTIKDKSEAAYRRSTALERRRALMKAWADFLAAKPGHPATPAG